MTHRHGLECLKRGPKGGLVYDCKFDRPPRRNPHPRPSPGQLPLIAEATRKVEPRQPPATVGAASRREKVRLDLEEKAAGLKRKMREEIHSYGPLGVMSDLGIMTGSKPRRGVPVGTPLGAYVFAKSRTPDRTTVERWFRWYGEIEDALRRSAALTVSVPHFAPGTTVGGPPGPDFDRAKTEGLLSPEEISLGERIRTFWRKHPDAKWGVWRTDGSIEPHLPAPEESERDRTIAEAKHALLSRTSGPGWENAPGIAPGARFLERAGKKASIRIILTHEGKILFRATRFHGPGIPSVSVNTETVGEAVRIAEEHAR